MGNVYVYRMGLEQVRSRFLAGRGLWRSMAMVLVVGLVFTNVTFSQKTWDRGAGTNNWGDANNWNPNGVPSASDAVTIPDNSSYSSVVVNVNASCASLTMSSGNDPLTVSINSGITLTVSGDVSIGAPTDNSSDKIISVGAGTLNCGSLSMGNPSGGNDDCILNISTGTVTVTGDVAMSGSSSENYINITGAGTLNLGGSISGGTIATTTGTVNYNGSSAQSVSNYSYYNLTLSGAGAKTLGGDRTITGNLLIESGATLSLGGNDLTINIGSNRTATINGTLNIDGNGRLTESGSGTKTLILGSGGYLSITDNGGSTLPALNAFSFNANSTVEYGSTDNQTVSRTPTYGNLVLSGSGNKSFTSGGATTIAGELALSGSAVALLASGTTSTANTLSFSSVYQIAGQWGGTASIATNKNSTWFGSSTTGILNVATTVLPIHLLSFTGKAQASTIELQWATATEQNNDYMAVERSADGKVFDEIGRVPGHGTTLEPQSYTLTDRRPLPGINYYRLRQVDFDGAIEYHPVISVSFKGNAANGITLQAYPNPVQDELSIAWNTASANDQAAAQLRIMDASGRLVAQYALTGNGGVFTAPVAALPVGLYFLQLEQGGKVQVGRFVKE